MGSQLDTNADVLISHRDIRCDRKRRAGEHEQNRCGYGVSIFHNLISLHLSLALCEFSLLRTHFWPFTYSFRKFWPALQKKFGRLDFFLTRLRLKSYGGQAADYTDGTDGAEPRSRGNSQATRLPLQEDTNAAKSLNDQWTRIH